MQEKAKTMYNNKEIMQQMYHQMMLKKQEKIDLKYLIEILKLNKNDMDSHIRL